MNILASQALQIFLLPLVLHAFHNDRQSHGFRHIDDGFQDMDPLFNGIFIHMQEMRIHLQHVNIQFEKHVQGRIPAAEIVHQHHETVIAEFPHHSLHFFRIVRTGGFGYFNLQCLFGKLVLLYKELNILGYIKRKDIDCRHIHRNGNQRQAPHSPKREPEAGPVFHSSSASGTLLPR